MNLQTHLFFVTKTNKRLEDLEHNIKVLIEENKELKQSLLQFKEDIESAIIYKECELCAKQTYGDLSYNDLEVCSNCYHKLISSEL